MGVFVLSCLLGCEPLRVKTVSYSSLYPRNARHDALYRIPVKLFSRRVDIGMMLFPLRKGISLPMKDRDFCRFAHILVAGPLKKNSGAFESQPKRLGYIPS